MWKEEQAEASQRESRGRDEDGRGGRIGAEKERRGRDVEVSRLDCENIHRKGRLTKWERKGHSFGGKSSLRF